MCTYPASVAEVSEYVGPRVGVEPAVVEETLRDKDVPALAACNAIEHDPTSGLVCLDERHEPFADRARRAIDAGALTYQKPPRITHTRWAPAADGTRPAVDPAGAE